MVPLQLTPHTMWVAEIASKGIIRMDFLQPQRYRWEKGRCLCIQHVLEPRYYAKSSVTLFPCSGTLDPAQVERQQTGHATAREHSVLTYRNSDREHSSLSAKQSCAVESVI